MTAASVSDRRREFAIRLAVGASPARVWRMVIADVGRVTLAGTLLGIAGAVLVHALFRNALFVTLRRAPPG